MLYVSALENIVSNLLIAKPFERGNNVRQHFVGRGRRPRRPVRRIISYIMAVLWAVGFFGASRRRPLPNDKSQRLPLGWGRSRRGKDAENVDGFIHRHSESFPLFVALFGY